MTKARDLANFVSTENELTILDKVLHEGDTNTSIRFPANDTVTVETSGAERMRITSAGNVGIGTTSPSTPLHVVGASTLASVNVSDSVTTTADDDGTLSSGTYTPTPVGGNMKRIVNNGAFTFAAPTASGDYTLIVQMTNSASAGAVTFSGFNKVAGATLTTTNGDDFLFTIVKINGFTFINAAALQ